MIISGIVTISIISLRAFVEPPVATALTFDWTVTLGNLLTIFGMLGGITVGVMTMRSDIRLLNMRIESTDRRVSATEKHVEKVAEAIIETSRQSMWLKSHDQRLDDINRRVISLENKS